MVGGVCWLKPLTWRYCGRLVRQSDLCVTLPAFVCLSVWSSARLASQNPASEMRRNAPLKQCLALLTIFEENHDSKVRTTLLVKLLCLKPDQVNGRVPRSCSRVMVRKLLLGVPSHNVLTPPPCKGHLGLLVAG